MQGASAIALGYGFGRVTPLEPEQSAHRTECQTDRSHQGPLRGVASRSQDSVVKNIPWQCRVGGHAENITNGANESPCDRSSLRKFRPIEAQIPRGDTGVSQSGAAGIVMRWMRQESGAEFRGPDSSREAGGSPAKRRLLAGLLLIFCCWHAGFLIVSIIPRGPGQDEPGSPAMDLYRLLTGGRQVWNMFETIPVLHSMDARLEGEDEAGRTITAGCVLPGFTPYPKPESSRHYALFHRLLWSSNGAAFREAYLRKAANLLQNQRDSGARGNWSLVVDADYTRNMFYSRRDGLMSLRVTKTFGPDGQVGTSP